MTETWGRPALLDSFVTFAGYCLFRQDRLDRSGGGVFLLVRQDLRPSLFVIPVLPLGIFEDSVWCSIPVSFSKKLVVGCLYRSPHSSSINNQCLKNLFDNVCQAPFDYQVIVGDFNCPDINWENMSSTPSSQFLVDCCSDNFLTQLVSSPTREHHILDLVFVNDSTFVSDTMVGDNFPGSDHKAVFCSMVFDFRLRNEQYQRSSSHHTTKRFDFTRADWVKYRLLLDRVPWVDFLCDESIELIWKNIKTAILNAAESAIPQRVSTARICGVPLSGEVRLAFRRRKKIFSNLRYSSSPLADNLRKKADDDLNQAIMLSRKNFERRIANDCFKSPKRFWGYVRSAMVSKPKICAVVDNNNNLTSNDLDSATIFNSFFTSVFTNEPDDALPTISLRTTSVLNDLEVSVEAISTIIRSLPMHSAPGPDGISNVLLRQGSNSFFSALSSFFSTILAKRSLPQEWKRANVIPIFKSGPRTQCSNYRPVSLTCTLCKVFERLIKNKILSYLMDNSLLAKSQHGFLPRRSCCSALLSYLEKVTFSVDDRQVVDVLYLDLSKAFDRVPHKRLLLKLKSYGIGGPVLHCVSSFLTDRQQRVQIGSSLSSFLPVTSGVPQGSVLGPLLFLLYVNDLDDCIAHSSVFKFADDIKLCMEVSSSNGSFSHLNFLQDDLSRVQAWCSTWLLKLNTTKCACIHFGFNNPCRNYMLDDVMIKNVNLISDLGVIITNNLKPSDQCLKACASAHRMLAVIKLAFKFLDIGSLTHLYKTYVRPLLEYCSVVWCPFYAKDIDSLEKVQRRFTRILPDHRDLPYRDRLGHYKLMSLYARRLLLDLTCVYKIIHGYIDVDANYFFSLNSDHRTRGHNFKFIFHHSRLDTRQHWFSSRVVAFWNELPMSCVNATSVGSFKLSVLQHFKTLGVN